MTTTTKRTTKTKTKTAKKAGKKPATKTAKPAAPGKGYKTTELVAMLQKGATAERIAKTLGWLPHTLRGALSRLKTVQGLKIERERVDGTTSYRIG